MSVPLHIKYIVSNYVCIFFIAWMSDYNAVSVKIEWFIECLFQYQFMKIKAMSTPIPMTFDTADKLGILEYFEFL